MLGLSGIAVPVGDSELVVEVPLPSAGAKLEVMPGSVEMAGVAEVND